MSDGASASWARAVEQARALFRWHRVRRLGCEAQDLLWTQTVLAVILWRTAREQACHVDDITVSAAVVTSQRAAAGSFHSGELPAIGPRDGELPPPEGTADALRAVEQVLAVHLRGPVVAGATPGPDLLGYVVRELRADPEMPGEHGGWAPLLSVARLHIRTAGELWRSGVWQITEHDHAAARATSLVTTSPPAYDYPPAPDPATRTHPSWLQQACWLTELTATLRSAGETLPRSADGTLRPLHIVLQSYAGLCASLAPAVGELEALWARRDVLDSADAWDLEHVPSPLLQQTMDIGSAVNRLAVFVGSITLIDPS
ncbi:hypothetical protein [Streptomyces celluloflavus]|uniref:hypothetical protein n=1 Tax=Streptomyces celluloflavus TaxID=58344 RepID=UPI00346127ED|nr:hypothetical protein OG717_30080 [Streptomyces celluloflavus]